MGPDEATNIIGFVLLAILIGASLIAMLGREQQLYDPEDQTVVWLDQVISASTLEPSKAFSLQILRQSGNEQQPERIFYRDDDAPVDPSGVINEALKTFRTAKIEGVVVVTNNTSKYEFSRMWHDHRGVKEGKKVERAIITALPDYQSLD